MSGEGDKSGIEIVSGSAAETIEIGRKIGAAMKGGEVVALTGPLGSGKTHLIKGIASGAGATDSEEVNSPTFVIVNEYLAEGDGLDVYHIDAYRIESDREFDMLGFDDFCYRRSVVVIEWADKVAGALGRVDCVGIEMSHVDQGRRGIYLKDAGQYIVQALK